jgi:hypothetical protein
MSEKKPVPIPVTRSQRLCPVCGKASYSSTGTHPQCSLARADAISKAARKSAGLDDKKKSPVRKSWSKPCPKCRRELPARRIVCDCGHTFSNPPVSKVIA